MIKLIDYFKSVGVELPKKKENLKENPLKKIGFNLCKDIYDNLEVPEPLERLDEDKLVDLICDKLPLESLDDCDNSRTLAHAICQKFGKVKIDEAKIVETIKCHENTRFSIDDKEALAKSIVKALEER